MSNTAQNRIGVSDDKGTFSMSSSEQPKEMSEVGRRHKSNHTGSVRTEGLLAKTLGSYISICLAHAGRYTMVNSLRNVGISWNYVDVGPFWARCTYSEYFACG